MLRGGVQQVLGEKSSRRSEWEEESSRCLEERSLIGSVGEGAASSCSGEESGRGSGEESSRCLGEGSSRCLGRSPVIAQGRSLAGAGGVQRHRQLCCQLPKLRDRHMEVQHILISF